MKIKVKNIISKIAAVGVMILMVFSAIPNVAFAADSATALETVNALGITTEEKAKQYIGNVNKTINIGKQDARFGIYI